MCEANSRLRRLYALAESNHKGAIETQTWRVETLKDPNPEALHAFVETARRQMEEAREALERHTSEHGC